MSDQNTNDGPFSGLSKLDEQTKQDILDNAEYQVQQVNSETKRAIQAGLESQASAAVAQALQDAGRILPRQRAQIIDKVHKQYGVHNYAGGK